MKYDIIFEQGNYRILEVVDECSTMDDLKGECFDPKVNPDVPADQLREEERDFECRIDHEGVFGYVLERWNPEIGIGWEHVDSCWGFVGQHSDTNEHYIVDELKQDIK